jgi:hypothetical protein
MNIAQQNPIDDNKSIEIDMQRKNLFVEETFGFGGTLE